MTSPHVIGTTAAKVTTTQKAAKVAVQKKTSVPKKAGKTAVQSPRSGGQSGRPSALKQVYRDGTYVGVGQTRIGAVQVAVTLKHDRITDVKITGYTTHYPISYIDPILPQELLQRQDINKIDVVSGATLSTEDFYYAVQSALAQAKQAEQRAVNGKS
ncbi:MAG: FMN-binding protein [Alicyclobacillaceae bacterium]|nr:FMN-binding protein [Alicyclobacillaceae bacterium]